MRRLTDDELKKIQAKEYELLKEFDRICKKNNIKYFLDGGTLLGAVRHKGFIPWDDDVDVAMLRSDYEKFKNIIDTELNNKYFFQDCYNDPNYGLTYGKLIIKNTKVYEKVNADTKAKNGIFIDIFPYDYNSNNSFMRKFNFIRAVILRLILMMKKGYKIDNDTLFKKMAIIVLKILSLFMSSKFVIKKFHKITNKYNNKNTNYLVNYSTAYLNKGEFNREWFTDLIDMPFEDGIYYGLKEYDNYLKYVYNDYMTLPPVEKRRSHGIIGVEFDNKEE